jgi:hypothetical protein
VSPVEVRAIAAREVAVKVEVASDMLGIPRSTGYELLRRGEYPVPVLKVARRGWKVPTAHILRELGLDAPPEEGRLRIVP